VTRRALGILAWPLLAWPGLLWAHPLPLQSDVPQSVVDPAPVRPRWPRPSVSLPQRRYYLANDDHTDYEWSATDTAYRSAFGRMLDYYMDLADLTALAPWDARSRFNMDGSVWVTEYRASHTPAEYARLINHIRDSSLTMPLNTCVQLYGAMPAEAVLRSFYPAGHIEREAGLRFPLVVPMENQTLPGGVASLWAGAGAKYSWKGICNCATCIGAGDRAVDVYRFVGPDGQGVLMKWNSSFWGSRSIGGYAEAHDPAGALDIMQNDDTYLNRWPYDIRAAFGYGWDDIESETDQFVSASQSLSGNAGRVIVSNEVDFFKDFESVYGNDIPELGSAFGNEWDLLVASIGETSAQVKRSVEKLRTAEALATVVSLYDPAFMNNRATARDSMNQGLGLYYEHSFSSGPGVSAPERAVWERSIQDAITRYVDTLHDDALVALGSMVPAGSTGQRFVVFNPLSWTRNEFVDLPADPSGSFYVVDLQTETPVASQKISTPDGNRVRVAVSAIPSVGYKTYEIRSGTGPSFTPGVNVIGNALDNGIYRVTLGGRGQLSSVLDHKDADRQLLNGAAFDLGNGSGSIVVENQGPVSVTLRVSSGGTPAHTSRVTLYTGLDRIDVEGRITQNFGNLVSYQSTFNLSGTTTRHEEVGMIAKVAREENGGDYANENTRTDWLTLNHFVDVSQATRGVTLSAWDSPFFQPGSSTVSHLDATTPSVRCVVGMMPDCVGGIPNQGGETNFLQRFSLRTHGAWDPAAAERFALEHQNPLVATAATGSDQAPLPTSPWSLVAISGTDVLLWALKPAEEGVGRGVVMRVWNLADSTRNAAATLLHFPLNDAWVTTHIETDLQPAVRSGSVVSDVLARQQMRTWRLVPAAAAAVEDPPFMGGLAIYPNPGHATDSRTIAFTMSHAQHVRVTVHDLRGAVVATLADGVWPAGRNEVKWNVQGVAAGVYFVRAQAGHDVLTGRTVVIQ